MKQMSVSFWHMTKNSKYIGGHGFRFLTCLKLKTWNCKIIHPHRAHCRTAAWHFNSVHLPVSFISISNFHLLFLLFPQWMLSKWVHWDLRGRMRLACGAWSPRTARRAWTRRAWHLARGRRSLAALLVTCGRTASAPAAGTTGGRWSPRPRSRRTPPLHLPLTRRKTRNHWGCTVSYKLVLFPKL